MSTLRVNNIKDASGGTSNLKIDGAAKAWFNFNGTGTVAIGDSLNVSSITDNSTGNYTVNFTTSINNANYATALVHGNFHTQTARLDACLPLLGDTMQAISPHHLYA